MRPRERLRSNCRWRRKTLAESWKIMHSCAYMCPGATSSIRHVREAPWHSERSFPGPYCPAAALNRAASSAGTRPRSFTSMPCALAHPQRAEARERHQFPAVLSSFSSPSRASSRIRRASHSPCLQRQRTAVCASQVVRRAAVSAGSASARVGYRTLIAGSVLASKDAAIMGHHDRVTQCSRLGPRVWASWIIKTTPRRSGTRVILGVFVLYVPPKTVDNRRFRARCPVTLLLGQSPVRAPAAWAKPWAGRAAQGGGVTVDLAGKYLPDRWVAAQVTAGVNPGPAGGRLSWPGR